MSNNKKRAIYLDTNILKQFSILLDHPLFSMLLELSKIWHFAVYIPEVAYMEWISSKKVEIENNLTNIKAGLNNIKSKYLFNEIDQDKLSVKEIFDKSKSVLDENLEKNNIEIVKTCEIDIDRLINMAINKIRPFEEKGEKGFKDSVILFSILNHAKKENNICYFISNDKIFAHEDIKSLVAETGVEYHLFSSIETFKEYIEKEIIKILAENKKDELAKLEKFLKSKEQQISEFIKEKGKFEFYELNHLLIIPSLLSENMLEIIHKPPREVFTIPHVRKINNIDLLEIEAPSLPVETKKEFIPLYFLVKIKFYVTVEWTTPQNRGRKRVGIEGIDFSNFGVTQEIRISEEVLEGKFPTYASIKTENSIYTELKLKEVGGLAPFKNKIEPIGSQRP